MNYIDYNEDKIHGKPDFPIQYYFVDRYHEQYIMPLHWHREFEIIQVKSGFLKIFLNNTGYTLCAGENIIICGGTLHRSNPTEDCVYECAVFDPLMLCKHKNDAACKYILPVTNGVFKLLPNCANGKEVAKIISELFVSLKNRENELKIYSLLYDMFFTFYKEELIIKSVLHERTKKQSDNINKILQYIKDNYSGNISLADLANVSGLNEKYVCKLFKKYTSVTPTEYINGLRTEHACHLMIHSDLSVTEAALESGFNDLSYFSKIFKRIKGETPREYKRNHSSV